MTTLRRPGSRLRLAAGAGVAVALLLPWLITSRYTMGILNVALISTVLVLGFNVAMGYTGLVSVGHAGLWATGAYTAALLATRLGWPFYLTLPAAVLVATAAGALLGFPALRLKGLYLAMATLGFGMMIQLSLINGKGFTGGADGVRNIPPPAFGPLVISTPRGLFLLVVCAAAAAWFSLRIAATRYGRGLRAIQSHELAAELLGSTPLAKRSGPSVCRPGWPGWPGRSTPTPLATSRRTSLALTSRWA